MQQLSMLEASPECPETKESLGLVQAGVFWQFLATPQEAFLEIRGITEQFTIPAW